MITPDQLLLAIGAFLVGSAICYELGLRDGGRAARERFERSPEPEPTGPDHDALTPPAERPPLTCIYLDGSQLTLDVLQAHVIYHGHRVDLRNIDRAVRRILSQRD